MALGKIAFLGSGETSLAGGRIFESLVRDQQGPARIALMETPAGFELNSTQVVRRVGDFMMTRLQNYKPVIDIVPARRKNSAFDPNDAEIVKPLLYANIIFMGPGSPTYAIRHLKDTLAWDMIRARHRLGATLIFASAATISIGAHALAEKRLQARANKQWGESDQLRSEIASLGWAVQDSKDGYKLIKS